MSLTYCQCTVVRVGHSHIVLPSGREIRIPIRSLAYLNLVVKFLRENGHPNLAMPEATQLRFREFTAWEANNQSEQSLRYLCR